MCCPVVVWATRLVFLVFSLSLFGCAELSYYLHSAKGQFEIMSKTRDIDDVLADKSISPKLSKQLFLIKKIRQFALQKLLLPESESYTEYADLERKYVLKNLFAAKEFSTQPHRWCYPFVGCTSYRGYFEQSRLDQYVKQLKQQNYDIYVGFVPAYSTLGWFDDPVLNTFVYWPEQRLAGLIFHELTHQLIYIDDDSAFNESLAVAVQQSGVELWLTENNQSGILKRYRQRLKNRQQVIQLIIQGREKLRELYEKDLPDDEKRLNKKRILNRLKQAYDNLAGSFEVSDGFKRWFSSELNNAKLLSISTYHKNAAAFKNMLKHHRLNYALFYQHVRLLADLDFKKRQQCLSNWLAPQSGIEVHCSLRINKS